MRRAKSMTIHFMVLRDFDEENSFLMKILSQTEFPLLKKLEVSNENICSAILDRSQLESIEFSGDELALLPKLSA